MSQPELWNWDLWPDVKVPPYVPAKPLKEVPVIPKPIRKN